MESYLLCSLRLLCFQFITKMMVMALRRFFYILLLLAVLLPASMLSAGRSAAQDLPSSAFVSGVIGHAQTYSLSCESRAAADWAAYWGVNISETDFLNRLPKSDNPDEGFVGSPHGVWGAIPPNAYGVHAAPVAALLREYGIDARTRNGMTWDELRAEAAAGKPVIVWVIGAMWGGTPIQYQSSNGNHTTVAHYEHVMIFTGYDPSYVYVIDSYSGYSQAYTISAFLNSWSVLGNMAVTGPERAAPSTDSGRPATYIVQRGDYLAELARRFGLHWMDIANLNGLVYPYVIYSGQELKLPGSVPQPEPAPTPVPPTQVPATAQKNVDLKNAVWLPLIFQEVPTESPPAEVSAAPAPDSVPTEYTVQKGEYLIELARRYNLNWEDIARLNNLWWPFTLYPGQVLKLK